MTITPKPQNQKPKKQNFEETFWFSLQRWFFGFHFVFFWFWNAKNKKNLFFWCLMIFSNHKLSKNKKHEENKKKKTFFEAKPKSPSKFWFFGFWFCVCFVFFGFWWFSPTINLQNVFSALAFQNQKKSKWKPKKHLVRLNQKVFSKFWFFGFLVLYLLWSFNPCTWPEAFLLQHSLLSLCCTSHGSHSSFMNKQFKALIMFSSGKEFSKSGFRSRFLHFSIWYRNF